jgi:hypothetical protein
MSAWSQPRAKRIPYVGDGRDGCLRSAQIDREEADGMSPGEDRDARLSSAFSWDRQAEQEPVLPHATGWIDGVPQAWNDDTGRWEARWPAG